MSEEKEQSSAGHKLGQLVGDWFQDYFATPLLKDVANRLELFLDYRECKRAQSVRSGRILWPDEYGNKVDYDFVMELNGSANKKGIPVAFLECFWRRGARHSKDKARDDSGKLMPMRSAYPTARFLGIVASGEFTRPARELVESRNINLLYIPKAKVVETFNGMGLIVDYPDKSPETAKALIANTFGSKLSEQAKIDAAKALRRNLGEAVVMSYISGVQAALSSPPLEFRIIGHKISAPMVFESVAEVTDFLSRDLPEFDFGDPKTRYSYQVSYSDGTEFELDLGSFDELKSLHLQISELTDHMNKVLSKNIL